jgi:hypothetical protein
MEHLICRVERFEIDAPYTIRVDFDDSTRQVIDFRPVLRGEIYGPLRDLALFNRVSLDAEVHTLVWPNGADFDLRHFTNGPVAQPPLPRWRAPGIL